MAIKPTDAIIYLEPSELRTYTDWHDAVNWHDAVAFRWPPFWEKFLEANVNEEWTKNAAKYHYDRNRLVKERFKPYGEYKVTNRGKTYLKFRSHSALSFFLLKWS